MTWDRRHLLDVADMSATELETVFERSALMRSHIDQGGAALPDLAGHHVALLFAEPSTRTRLSFEIAVRRLSGETSLLDPPSSSMVKGESLADTTRNLEALGYSILVVRHHRSGAAHVAARHFSGSVVNAGDGWSAHPSQALLDLFTLRRAFESASLAGRKVVIVGDLLHSRVARSNVWTLLRAGADVWLCGPPAWLRGYDQVARSVTLTDDMDAAMRDADAVMALRVQRERMSGSTLSIDEYVARYQVNSRTLARARPGAWFLHPGPINEGVEVSRAVALGPRSLVLEQARNGVPVRMAVLSLITSAATADQAARGAPAKEWQRGRPRATISTIGLDDRRRN